MPTLVVLALFVSLAVGLAAAALVNCFLDDDAAYRERATDTPTPWWYAGRRTKLVLLVGLINFTAGLCGMYVFARIGSGWIVASILWTLLGVLMLTTGEISRHYPID